MECFDPIAFSVGSFQIHWYAICFLFAWGAAFVVVEYLEKREKKIVISKEEWEDLFWWLLFGAIVGGRLGFALFYHPEYFRLHPEQIFIPYNFIEKTWLLFQGMSFHGGLIGIAGTLWVWAKKKNISVLTLTDRLVVVAPIVSIFGRLGNFLNQELPGRVTDASWGMYFKGEEILRHPSTLYGAFFEGILLLGWMMFWQKRIKTRGSLTIIYLLSYALIRFFLEFFREPDWYPNPWSTILTQGQWLSIIMFGSGIFLWFWSKKYAKIDTNDS